jgi:hypothetical protein
MLKGLAVGLATLFVATGAAQAQCPATGQPGQQFALAEGFTPDPNRHRVTAGGDLDLSRCPGVPGRGWVTFRPDFIVRYQTHTGATSRKTLTFRVESSADTILLINDPGNRWHWDDDLGKNRNARIRFPNARSGRYDIWVGTYKKGQRPSAQLSISEIK